MSAPIGWIIYKLAWENMRRIEPVNAQAHILLRSRSSSVYGVRSQYRPSGRTIYEDSAYLSHSRANHVHGVVMGSKFSGHAHTHAQPFDYQRIKSSRTVSCTMSAICITYTPMCVCVRNTFKYKSRLVFMGLKSTLLVVAADACVCARARAPYSQFSIRYKHVHCVHMDVSLPLNN